MLSDHNLETIVKPPFEIEVNETLIQKRARNPVSKVATQCTIMKFTSTTCNTYEMEKIVRLLSVKSEVGLFGQCSIFGKPIAKHCQFSLTEVTVITKNYTFLVVNKHERL